MSHDDEKYGLYLDTGMTIQSHDSLPTLKIFLLGAFSVKLGEKVLLPASNSARSLLAYLFFYRHQTHSRTVLAGSFWPDLPEERARRALSQALWHIRNCLPGIVETTGQEIYLLEGHYSFWIDTEIFERQTSDSDIARDQLLRTIDLYRGDLLEGNYENWILLERERLKELYFTALENLIQSEKAEGNYQNALNLGLRLTKADPLRESAYREVLRLYYLLNRPEAALQQYALCKKILQDELGVEPESETTALAQEIANRSDHLDVPYLPETTPPSSDASSDGSYSTNLPLIGRQAERCSLLSHIEAMFNHFGGVVLLEGEAGIGKSRLLQEIARDAEWRGAQVLWGWGREARELQPYAAFTQALQSGLSPLRISQIEQVTEELWLQSLKILLPKLKEARPNLEDAPTLDPVQERSRLTEAIVCFLEGWSQVVPLVIMLEDLHWADQDTLELLPVLAKRLTSSSVIVICSYRGEDARANSLAWKSLQTLDRSGILDRLMLSGLDKQATGELICRCLRLGNPAPRFEDRLYHETDGNALFVLETLRTLQDDGLLSRSQDGVWFTPWDETTTDYNELPLSPRVEKIITSRLNHLPDALQNLLKIAAVIGSRFDFAMLGIISGLETSVLFEATRKLLQRSFIEETDVGYRFSHDKIHHAVYAKILKKERLHIHYQVACYIEENKSSEIGELAHHYWLAQIWDKAAYYNQRAGEAAKAIYANSEAVKYFDRALDALDELPLQEGISQRIALLKNREIVNGLLGERTAQRADLKILDDLLSDLGEKAAVTLRWASYYEALSDYSSAIETAQKTIELAMQNDLPSVQIAGLLVWARVLIQQADLNAARNLLSDAHELACRIGDRSNEALSLYFIASTLFEQGYFEESENHCQQALQVFRSLGDREHEADCLRLMANTQGLGKLQRAVEYLKDALQIRQMLGDRRGEAQTKYNLAVRYHFAGDDVTSLCYCREMTATAQAIGDLRLEAYGLTYLGLLLEKSEPQQSYEYYARALEIRQEIGQPAMQVDSRAGMARALFQMGRTPEAESHIRKALAWVDKNGTNCVGDMWLVYMTGYRVFTAANKPGDAAFCIETAYAYLEEEFSNKPDEASRARLLVDEPELQDVFDTYREYQFQKQGVRCSFRLPSAAQSSDDVDVLWTIQAPDDALIKGKVARRRHQLQRLLTEAQEQGGAPTYQHLADALGVGLRTIERDVSALKEQVGPSSTD
jgi:predicted ATPase/DNA-binding SARP family transcriptional activator